MTEFVEVGRWNTRNPVCHTRDCPQHPQDTTTWLKSDAEDLGLRECMYCSGSMNARRRGIESIIMRLWSGNLTNEVSALR